MKKVKVIALVLILLAACCTAGWLWFDSRYVIIHEEVYSRSVTEMAFEGEELPDLTPFQELESLKMLDLRGFRISTEEYEQIKAQFPECSILWKVPFQEGFYDPAISELSVTCLNEQDLDLLRYFPGLEMLDARGCTDYDVLNLAKERYPDLTVIYTVTVGQQELRENTEEVKITDGEVPALLDAIALLPQLKSVDAMACTDYDALMQLRDAYPDLDVRYAVAVGGVSYPCDSVELSVENPDLAEIEQMLPCLPEVSKVVLSGALPDNEQIYETVCRWPDVVFDWAFEVCGVETRSTESKLILSNILMNNTDEVEASLKYFYHLERVEMCECGISSQKMDALGKRHPETRFVWTVRIGYGKLRTDATAFIPFKIGYWIERPFYDDQAKELKYCIDLECLDLGHMKMRDISFLQYMPKMKYLIVADTVCKDYSVIGQLTDLIYLEIFLTPMKDATFLLNLTKLQNLNISWTESLQNPEVLFEMTWLKRLWATNCGLTEEQNEQLKAALPDAVVYTTSKHPTEGGWRQSDLYYKMRDLLDMHYME